MEQTKTQEPQQQHFVTDWQQMPKKESTYKVDGDIDFNPDDYLDCHVTAMSDTYDTCLY